MVRDDAPDTTVVVRSRHRVRALAELSRRLDADRMKLLPGCRLVVADLRNDAAVRPLLAAMHVPSPPEAARRIAA